MLQTSIDGVPVFHAAGPAPLTAGLVFGVGRRDESFVTGGLTHLVEHLTMRAVGRTTLNANASVDLTATEFFATGPADRVVDFLRAVCLALADLPTEQLAVEADVLRAEGGTIAAPPVALLLGELYGTVGVGLAAAREPALRSLDAAAVREWTRRYFVRGNAALWLSGAVPDGLALPLADGPPPDRAPQWRQAIATPAWGGVPIEEHVVLGAELPSHPALGSTMGVLRSRLEEELRHRRGVAYSVETDKLGIDGESRVLVLTSDVRPGHEAMAAQMLWREVHRLADQGPSETELAQERAALEAFLEDPRFDIEQARAFAHAVVTGVPAKGAGELRADAAALDAGSIRQMAAAVRDAAVLLVPGETELQLPGLHRLPAWSPDVVQGRTFVRKRLRGVPKEAQLTVGDDGVSLVLGDDRRITVRWRDAVGLVRLAPGEWILVGRDGFSLPLSEEDWRDGAEAVALVRAAVPPELQVVDDDAHDDGLLLLRAPAHRVAEAVALGTFGARLVSNGEWTAVLADGELPAEAVADQLSAVVGRSTTGLVLRRTHADLEYVLLRGAKVVDHHRSSVAPGDALLLAQATGRPQAHTSYLLGVTGTPDEVVGHVVQALGLPAEVPALLDGAPVEGGQRVEARGIVGGFRASVRGEFEPPPGTGHGLDRYRELSRRRPRWFRLANVGAVVLLGLYLWGLVALREYLPDWRFYLFMGLGVIGLLNSIWDSRPPRRRPAAPSAEAPLQSTSTG
jgi:predicted Zn-dependent peptidase